MMASPLTTDHSPLSPLTTLTTRHSSFANVQVYAIAGQRNYVWQWKKVRDATAGDRNGDGKSDAYETAGDSGAYETAGDSDAYE